MGPNRVYVPLIACHTMWILTHALFAETFETIISNGLNDSAQVIGGKFTFAADFESFQLIRT